jgi:ATP-dependent helicase/nuclease subunit A
MNPFTPQQTAAIEGRGNLLVVAGAGTGKTHTLIGRCLRLITQEYASVDRILMVTFTEAAAAEMRGRLREELTRLLSADPENERLAEQVALLDTAHISTLHGFCLQLAREHFHELGLDPQFNILDESQTRPLQRETLDVLFEKYYAGRDETSAEVRELIRSTGRGSNGAIRKLILKLHAFSQSLPDPDAWLNEQARRFSKAETGEWCGLLGIAVNELRDEWSAAIHESRGESVALGLTHTAISTLPEKSDHKSACDFIRAIAAADIKENWKWGTKGKFRDPLGQFFDACESLVALLPDGNVDPLAEDWTWARGAMATLIRLVSEFSVDFAARKRELGGVDFADLEQCALELLRDPEIRSAWQARLDHVFVDEYQDINAAQDAILTALSRETDGGNRFLVGDVKQSIYRFRLANPHIFQNYNRAWSGIAAGGTALSLTENFRTRQAILDFINPLFASLMRLEIGGVDYEPLEFGSPNIRALLANTEPRVELHLLAKSDEEYFSTEDESDESNDAANLLSVEREARLLASRFAELKRGGHQVWDKAGKCFRAVRWSDMAVLLRSPSGRAEAFAKEFSRAGIPISAARDGFYASIEVCDVINLLRLLDNPLQDVPLAAVLRSPLVGFTLDELVQIRIADRGDLLWNALIRVPVARGEIASELRSRVSTFLEQFNRWRKLARQTSLTQTIETALNETHYEALLLAGERGVERVANIRRLLDLARQFDPFQRQGLHRFLRFVRLQEDEELDLEPSSSTGDEAVSLISIHRSKGLEFPVVAIPCLGTQFNEQDLRGEVLLDETLGLCPRITPPGANQSYASLPYQLAQKNAAHELRAEEMRLLYVATTRARDTLILVGSINEDVDEARWSGETTRVTPREILKARSHLDWLKLWLPRVTTDGDWQDDRCGANRLLRWWIVSEVVGDEVTRLGNTNEQSGMTADVVHKSDEVLSQIIARLDWNYPHRAATDEAAKTSVTALRKRAADDTDDEARPMFRVSTTFLAPKAETAHVRSKLSAAEIGIAHHTFQQHVSVERTLTELDLRNEAAVMLEAGLLNDEQHGALDFGDLGAFWQSDIGSALRGVSARSINREMEFTASLTSNDMKTIPALCHAGVLAADDFVVVQGQVDLAVVLEKEIWLLDFKTDAVDETGLAGKVDQYKPQLDIYAIALEKIYRRPVTRCWLHFLRARKTVEM